MKRRILAVDPGITSGYSLGLCTEKSLLVTCDQMEMDVRVLNDLLKDWDPHYLITESFEYRNKPRKGLELFSRNLIGVMQLHDLTTPTVKFKQQMAAQGKGHYNDTKLKKMNVYVAGREHGRDALRHLLQWWTFGGGYQFNKKQPISLVREEYIRELGE